MESLILLENLIEDTQSKNEIMLKLIEEEALGDFVEKISKSNRIFVYGKGVSSSIVGQELKRAFTKLGKYVFDFYKADEFDSVLSLIREDDCIILIDIENSKDYLNLINEKLRGKNVSRFFIGLDKGKKVPICTYDFNRIDKNYDEIYKGLELYSMLIRFLYELCKLWKWNIKNIKKEY